MSFRHRVLGLDLGRSARRSGSRRGRYRRHRKARSPFRSSATLLFRKTTVGAVLEIERNTVTRIEPGADPGPRSSRNRPVLPDVAASQPTSGRDMISHRLPDQFRLPPRQALARPTDRNSLLICGFPNAIRRAPGRLPVVRSRCLAQIPGRLAPAPAGSGGPTRSQFHFRPA